MNSILDRSTPDFEIQKPNDEKTPIKVKTIDQLAGLILT